ncbi:nad p h oxidoreductase-related [Anaeramoeba flamelloides]|uniref:Nad p h oxidoreductase-related n=1 Tax=Anaeramoeba flamelloides TaxID=1746091 RepID=A0AAV7ZS16_9EUKA|nr:nad p h oxidoreductase-related [Anaeramoeba flamelloides]
MKVFIVYAHPEPKSFNSALKNTAVEVFEELGYEVKVSDLYEMNFKAIADRNDFTEISNNEKLVYQMEQKKGKLTQDILAEHEKIEWADLIIFQFPLWWFTVPAIMKGYFDRVFTVPFAYYFPRLYDKGVFTGKKCLISVTTGGLDGVYLTRGLMGNASQILYPLIHGLIYFCGFQALSPEYFWAVAHSEEKRINYLKSWKRRLTNIHNEEPIQFNKIEDYEDNGRGELKSGKITNFQILGKDFERRIRRKKKKKKKRKKKK